VAADDGADSAAASVVPESSSKEAECPGAFGRILTERKEESAPKTATTRKSASFTRSGRRSKKTTTN